MNLIYLIFSTFVLWNTAKDSPFLRGEFGDSFDSNYRIEETRLMEESASLRWWINSGGYFYVEDGVGKTAQGEAEIGSMWYEEYLEYNPESTDNGVHPQNIFRLVQRNKWENFSQEVYFKVNKYYESLSPNRDASNGMFLFNRYLDGDNLYYTGLRVDGAVVIKKKYRGVYYTMAIKKVLEGTYDHTSDPNLIPVEKWIGLKSELVNENNGVKIKVYVDWENDGYWKEELNVIDGNGKFGEYVIYNSGYAGIRSDFMDIFIDNYKIKKI